jgi:hypothetical protein
MSGDEMVEPGAHPSDLDVDWKEFVRGAGIAFVVVGILAILLVPIFATLGPQPSDPQALMLYLNQNRVANLALAAIQVLARLVLVPAVIGLYVYLRPSSKPISALALAFWGVFIVVSLIGQAAPVLSLMNLSDQYVAATSDSSRVSIVAAARSAQSFFASGNLLTDLNLGIAFFATGIAMLKSRLPRPLSYLGLIVGIVAPLDALTGLLVFEFLFLVLGTLWFLLTGYKLFSRSS